MLSDSIGKITLSRTTELRFDVSPYKGKKYINIRQYVESANFTGYTKKGIALTQELGSKLFQAFQNNKQTGESNQQVEICRLTKSDTTELIAQIIPPDEKHTTASIDVREYIQSETYTGWTQKGFRLPLEKWDIVVNLLGECLERLGKENTSGIEESV